MSEPVLELKNISKRIKGKDIVKDVSLSVYGSEIFGFLGPNGAGKTTTIRMIVGLIRPTSGDISIYGHFLKSDFKGAISNIGCIIESPDLYKYMSGLDNLQQFAVMKNNVDSKRIAEVVELVGLQNRIKDKVGTYSLGMRQRLGIAQAILSRPKLLILDEPTNGLDPSGIAEFRNLIRLLAYEEGMSVFISSHILSEIQLMCDSVTIIKQGKSVKSLKVNEFNQGQIIEWQLDNPSRAVGILKDRWSIEAQMTKKNALTASIGVVPVDEINSLFINEGLKLSFCSTQRSSLEDLFLNLTEGDEIV
ncbi:MAG: ABC transporter ATP-binding protein [Bacillota bacterium]|nr:ABC transporter ATP-binding protein [Bacillota bacterium]